MFYWLPWTRDSDTSLTEWRHKSCMSPQTTLLYTPTVKITAEYLTLRHRSDIYGKPSMALLSLTTASKLSIALTGSLDMKTDFQKRALSYHSCQLKLRRLKYSKRPCRERTWNQVKTILRRMWISHRTMIRCLSVSLNPATSRHIRTVKGNY